MITAGGLVLFAGNDSKLYALDKDTGKLIGTKDLPNGSLGVPAVYEVNGKQYVLLTVAGGNPFPGRRPHGARRHALARKSRRATSRSRCRSETMLFNYACRMAIALLAAGACCFRVEA